MRAYLIFALHAVRRGLLAMKDASVRRFLKSERCTILGPVFRDNGYAIPASGGIVTERMLRQMNLLVADMARVDLHNGVALSLDQSLGEVDLLNLKYLREQHRHG